MLKGAARILKRIWRPHHTFVVHMDIKANITVNATKTMLYEAGKNLTLRFLSIEPLSNWIKLAFGDEGPSEDNFVFIATQNVVWAGITMIQAELDLLSAAFRTGRWYGSHQIYSDLPNNRAAFRSGGIKRYCGVVGVILQKQRISSNRNFSNGKAKIFSKCGVAEDLRTQGKTTEPNLFVYR